MVVTSEGKLPAWRGEGVDEFGALVYSYMRQHDIRNPSELTKEMVRAGAPSFSRQTIVNYMTGETVVPTSFVASVAWALRLNKSEKTKLAYAACYREG